LINNTRPLSEQEATLSEKHAQLDSLQSQIEQDKTAIATQWQDWHTAEHTLGDRRTDLKLKQELLSIKQVRVQQLSQHLQTQSALYKQVYDLLNTTDKVRLSNKVDVAALEAMELDALSQVVSDLEKDLDKVSRFVSDQEEELNFEQEAIDELKQKIEAASEYDRLQLETELADEQDRYQMLNETLVGQRRNLLEREEVLTQHQAVLRRRQGMVSEESPVSGMDLEPVMAQIDTLRKQTSEEIQTIETEIKALQGSIESLKQTVEQLTQAQTTNRESILQAEESLRAKTVELATIEGQKDLADTLLPPCQSGLSSLKERLDDASASVSQFQEASDYQLQAIAEMRQIIVSFSGDTSQSAAS
jgi:chromosome segregation ATPase